MDFCVKNYFGRFNSDTEKKFLSWAGQPVLCGGQGLESGRSWVLVHLWGQGQLGDLGPVILQPWVGDNGKPLPTHPGTHQESTLTQRCVYTHKHTQKKLTMQSEASCSKIQ